MKRETDDDQIWYEMSPSREIWKIVVSHKLALDRKRVKYNNSCDMVLIFGSFLYWLFVIFFHRPFFFFDLVFYCIFFFSIWFFYHPFLIRSCFISVFFLMWFLTYLRIKLWQNHLRNEGFVSQDHIGGFSTKRECANTHK
jgi:hypothetical protein